MIEARKFKSMTIQTNPEMFNKSLPVHTVTEIDRAAGIVTLSGSDGSSHQVRLDSWGPFKELLGREGGDCVVNSRRGLGEK
jgi:hypothetical protein